MLIERETKQAQSKKVRKNPSRCYLASLPIEVSRFFRLVRKSGRCLDHLPVWRAASGHRGSLFSLLRTLDEAESGRGQRTLKWRIKFCEEKRFFAFVIMTVAQHRGFVIELRIGEQRFGVFTCRCCRCRCRCYCHA